MPYNSRLTYVSRSTSTPDNLAQHLTDIVQPSRAGNKKNNINAVLYYGNNYFFQCIEGRKTQVYSLFNKICNDPRHTDVVVLSYHEVASRSLTTLWLKFVRHDEEIQRFFNVSPWQVFNPYTLHEDHIDDFVDLLVAKDSSRHIADKNISPEKMEWHAQYNIPALIFCMVCVGVLIFYCYHVASRLHGV